MRKGRNFLTIDIQKTTKTKNKTKIKTKNKYISDTSKHLSHCKEFFRKK